MVVRGQAWKAAVYMSDTTPIRDEQVAYLIVLRHVLVVQDIAMTVAEFAPEARIITSVSPNDALPLLEGVGQVAVAFVGQGPSAFRGSLLEDQIGERGGRVVLLGEEAELTGPAAGYPVLTRPFTTESILQHLIG